MTPGQARAPSLPEVRPTPVSARFHLSRIRPPPAFPGPRIRQHPGATRPCAPRPCAPRPAGRPDSPQRRTPARQAGDTPRPAVLPGAETASAGMNRCSRSGGRHSVEIDNPSMNARPGGFSSSRSAALARPLSGQNNSAKSASRNNRFLSEAGSRKKYPDPPGPGTTGPPPKVPSGQIVRPASLSSLRSLGWPGIYPDDPSTGVSGRVSGTCRPAPQSRCRADFPSHYAAASMRWFSGQFLGHTASERSWYSRAGTSTKAGTERLIWELRRCKRRREVRLFEGAASLNAGHHEVADKLREVVKGKTVAPLCPHTRSWPAVSTRTCGQSPGPKVGIPITPQRQHDTAGGLDTPAVSGQGSRKHDRTMSVRYPP